MAAGITEPTGQKIGTTTIGATGGASTAGAVAVVLVWGLSLTGVNPPAEVVAALTVIVAAVGALVGGKLTPSNQVRTLWGAQPPTSATTPPPVPGGEGRHVASPVDVAAVEEPADDLDRELSRLNPPAAGSTAV